MKKPSEVNVIEIISNQRIDISDKSMDIVMRLAYDDNLSTKSDLVNLILSNSESEEELISLLLNVAMIEEGVNAENLNIGVMLATHEQKEVKGIEADNSFGLVKPEDIDEIITYVKSIYGDLNSNAEVVEKILQIEDWAKTAYALYIILLIYSEYFYKEEEQERRSQRQNQSMKSFKLQ